MQKDKLSDLVVVVAYLFEACRFWEDCRSLAAARGDSQAAVVARQGAPAGVERYA